MYMYDNAGGNVVATNCSSKIESDSDHNIECPKTIVHVFHVFFLGC